MTEFLAGQVDIAVIGAGHAGIEAALAAALMQLSFQDRTLFYRKYYYLQPTAQIAAELGMTERAVEGKLYRIKKRLRGRLGGVIHD